MSGTWINHQPLPNLPTPILTCTVANSKLYAVLQGDVQLPAIRSIDLTSSSWNWQQVQLTVASGNGGSEGNSSIISSSSSKKLSTGVIVAIVVVVVVLLILGMAFFWWRRRKSSSHMKEIEKAEAVPESIPVYPAPYNASQLINTSQPTPVLATQQAASWATQPNKQELFGYGQSQPSVSTPWSPANTAVVDTSYRDPNYQQLHTARNPLTVATTMSSQYAPSTTSSGVVAGDKQELTSEDNLVTLTPSTVNSFPSQLSPNASGSGIAQPVTSAPFNNLAPPNEPRLREVLSPGLANAQLILQQSQTPQH
ncbi:hypothetical protein BGZ49_005148 [Haplosporangium sp. Z 27]|nr:hypothetical protein BGZ49_005148 [Haplosporangium sp. Z 27]